MSITTLRAGESQQLNHCNVASTGYTFCTAIRPVARIFRRGVTWMSNLHKHIRLGGLGACSPRKFFEIKCSEIASAEVILVQKQSGICIY